MEINNSLPPFCLLCLLRLLRLLFLSDGFLFLRLLHLLLFHLLYSLRRSSFGASAESKRCRHRLFVAQLQLSKETTLRPLQLLLFREGDRIEKRSVIKTPRRKRKGYWT